MSSSTLSPAPTVGALLDQLEHAIAGLEQIDVRALSAATLSTTVLRMQQLADRHTACQARFLGEADRAAVWASSGARGVAGWLAEQTGGSYGRAVEMVKLADAMVASPLLAERLQTGAISPATAVVLHQSIISPPDAAGADAVDHLVELCTGAGPRDAKQAVEHWTAVHHTDSPEQVEDRRFARRSVRFAHPVDGMITTTAVLPTLHADRLRKLLGSLGGHPTADDPRTSEQCYADGLLALVDRGVRTDTAVGRRSATILVTIEADALAGHSDTPGRTEHGHQVPAHAVRELAENAVLHRVVTAGDLVLNVGRGQRLATEAQYAALVARDRGCRVEGCHAPPAWCEIDHIVPWTHGGTSDLRNLWLLCPHHHRLKHRPGVEVVGSGQQLALRLPDGATVECPPPLPRRRPSTAVA